MIDFTVGLVFAMVFLACYDLTQYVRLPLRVLILCGLVSSLIVASIMVLDRGTGATGSRVIAYVAGNAVGQFAEKRLRSLLSTGAYALVLLSLILAAFRDRDGDSEY